LEEREGGKVDAVQCNAVQCKAMLRSAKIELMGSWYPTNLALAIDCAINRSNPLRMAQRDPMRAFLSAFAQVSEACDEE